MNSKFVTSWWQRLRHFSLLGIYRFFRLKRTGKQLVIRGECAMCGRCCRRISLEAGGRWLRKERHFREAVERNPQYGRFRVVGKDSQGFLLLSCDWHTESGVCRDHPERLPVCKNFPDKNLYFTGGELPEGCGYRFVEETPFKRYLKEEMDSSDG